MRLRNDKLVDLINEKETIIVRNCKIVVVNTHMRMQVDAFGKIEISKDVNIDEVKMDKDMSSVVYDILPYANRTRYDGSRRDYKSDTHSQYTYDTRSHYSQQKINRNYNDNRSVMSDSHYSVGTFLSSQVGR